MCPGTQAKFPKEWVPEGEALAQSTAFYIFQRNQNELIGNEVMKNKRYAVHNSDRLDIYQIVIQGHLSGQWSDWFNGFTITLDQSGRTILVGPVIDQAALHGVLKKIRDLGMPLISVNRLDPGEEVGAH